MLWLIELDTSHDCHHSIIFSITHPDKQQPVRMQLLFVFILPSLPGSVSETYLYSFLPLVLCPFSSPPSSITICPSYMLISFGLSKRWLFQLCLWLPLALCVVICPRHSKHDTLTLVLLPMSIKGLCVQLVTPVQTVPKGLRENVFSVWLLSSSLTEMWNNWLLGAYTLRALSYT